MDLMNVPAEVEGHSFTPSWDNSGYLKKNFGSPWRRLRLLHTLPRERESLDTPFKVIQGLDFGNNRKRVYDFILVSNSNLGWPRLVILHRFRDIAGFLRSRGTPPIFNPNFGGVPVAPDAPCWGQPGSRGLKLFGREIIFEEFQPMWSRYLNVTHGQTDRQYMIAIPRFALKCIAR